MTYTERMAALAKALDAQGLNQCYICGNPTQGRLCSPCAIAAVRGEKSGSTFNRKSKGKAK